MLIKARVDFKKPDTLGIESKGMTPVDMHFHTNHSDAFTRVDQVLRVCGQKNIGVAITDHNSIKGVLEASRKKEDLLLIPGVEVTAKEGCHILFYFNKLGELKDFFCETVEPFKTRNPYGITTIGASALLNNSKNYDCLRVAAHPFAQANYGVHKCISRGYLSREVTGEFDAIEVVNAVSRRSWNEKSLAWANDLNKPVTGGSDGHSLFQLGSVVSYNKGKTVKSFLENIRRGENFVVGKETRLVKLLGNSRTVAKHLRYAKPILRLRYPLSYNSSPKRQVE